MSGLFENNVLLTCLPSSPDQFIPSVATDLQERGTKSENDSHLS